MEKDYLLSSYDYDLPEERIAQFPCGEPGSSRLLVTDRENGTIEHASFRDIASFLPENALLVANNARVLQARITWQRPSGGKAEFLLLTPLPLVLESTVTLGGESISRVECLLKPAGKFRQGDTIQITSEVQCRIIDKKSFGRHVVDLIWHGNLEDIFAKYGKLPLPPYIKREPEKSDSSRYQTVFASKTGAVAAPTAGLHFTSELRSSLEKQNFQICEITLYVGYGTFSPVREDDIRGHKMHCEYVELDAETAKTINTAKEAGRPIVAVGTTSLRALEGIAQATGKIDEFSGWTDIFIYPGFEFQVVDALVTNFHLPQSSLLMLVSAFAGRENILSAYAEAVKQGYRFFSYGDAMLIRKF